MYYCISNHQHIIIMTDKPSYEELEQQLAEAKKQLKKKSKNKETYAQKHVQLWEKFFEGKANLREFPRETRAKKTESMHHYFFERNDDFCFQYKTFILDMIEAYCLVKGLPKQRESMMRYELKKALSGKTKKPGKSVAVKSKQTPPAEKSEDVAKATQATYQSIMKTGDSLQTEPPQKQADKTTPQLLEYYQTHYGFPAELTSLYDVKADEWFQKNTNVPVPN